jgi:alkylation response protein AidB-like acyl-CoA dehydrogenase
MEFAFSAEQELLRSAVRNFLVAEAPMSFVRAHLEQPTAQEERLWPLLSDLGWPGLLVPEEHGGLGLGMVDLVVVMEEMGRALFPGPYLSSAVLATLAARELGLGDLLARLAAGTVRGTVALDESGHGDPIDRIRIRANGRGTRYRLEGVAPMVLDAHTADFLLVPARTREGLHTFLVERFAAEPVAALDLSRNFARVELDDVVAMPVGGPGDHTALWRHVLDRAAVAVAAELIGVSEAANDVAIDYAQAREVFGKPLSKFQVTRHKAVDLLREIELARVGVHYAAWALDADAPEATTAVAMAKSYAAEAANHVGAECIQIHGGVGYTWDCDAHLYLRRAKQNDLMLGAQGWQRARIAEEYFAAL